MKKPSTLLRSFSSKLSSCSRARRPSVAPWPPHRSPFDRWLDSEIDDLLLLPFASAATLSKALATATAAQETAVRSIAGNTASCRHTYLDDVLDLLDACSVVRQRIGDVRAYVSSLSIAAHWLDTDSVHVHAVQRAQAALCTCAALEKRCAELDTCGSSLRKLGERVSRPHESSSSSSSNNNDDELVDVEMLDGARAIALLVLGMANVALAFRTRRGVPTVVQSAGSTRHSWTDTLSEMQRGAREEYEKRRRDGVAVLEELRVAVMAARRLRGLLQGGDQNGEEMKEVVRELKRSCGKLEEGVGGLEVGVEGLYKGLMGVRMCLLGASSNQGHA